MLDINYIKSAVQRLAFEDMTYQQFASWSHAHVFKPVLAEAELEAWEDTMQIKLPTDFRQYLTLLGNGGAGPAYGIAPFKLSLEQELQKPCPYSDDQAELFNSLAQDWFDMSNLYEDELYELYYQKHPHEPRLSFEEWNKKLDGEIYEEMDKKLFCTGQVWIANQGCSLDIYLILNGSETGKCHCTNVDYDYSYPCTGKQRREFEQLEDKQERAAIWSEYKESLLDFKDYFMDYIEAGLEHLNSYSAEEKAYFQQEREGVLEFEHYMQENNLAELERLMGKLDPAIFTTKTRSFYLESTKQLLEKYPNNPVFIKFEAQNTFKPNTNYRYQIVNFEHRSRNNVDYPHPSFAEFKASFKQSPDF